jgi:hypothetical protein
VGYIIILLYYFLNVPERERERERERHTYRRDGVLFLWLGSYESVSISAKSVSMPGFSSRSQGKSRLC